MKLAKLSLAAIVAVGAMTTIASAQPLEEAIKGVEFSGKMEYTLNDVSRDSDVDNLNDEDDNIVESTTNDWDFLGKLTSPVADNLKATVVFASSANDSDMKYGQSKRQSGVDIRKAFFTYAQDGTTVIAGLQDLKTPVTNNGYNGDKGDGVVVMHNMGQVTAAAAYFGNTTLRDTVDVFAAGLMGSMDAFSARAWYVTAPEFVDAHYFLEGSVSMAGASLTAQYLSTKLDEVDAETGKFYAVKGAYAYENFGISATYTKNDEDQRTMALANPADSEVIGSGWRLANTNNAAFEKTMGIEGTAKFNEYGFILGYATADEFVNDTSDTTQDIKEVYAGVSYQYSKNFSTYVRYSDVDSDAANEDFQYLRFNAKYSF